MTQPNDYYVYVYIDPRNFCEFYYGKGKGSRKEAHLKDKKQSKKTIHLEQIKKAGLEPIIKVIATGLTEDQAFLVEKTLIWKAGDAIDNVSSGYFKDNFRPENQFHKNIPGFDFENDIFYLNVGEGQHRSWNDCKKYGFMAAGNGRQYSDSLKKLSPGDIVAAYVTGRGFVGIGKVTKEAVKAIDFRHKNRSLQKLDLECRGIFENTHDDERGEYLITVEWIKVVSKEEAFFKRNVGLYTPQKVRASLANQPKTLAFIESSFDINLGEIMSADS